MNTDSSTPSRFGALSMCGQQTGSTHSITRTALVNEDEPMIQEDQYEIFADILDTALDPGAWDRVLETLGRKFNSPFVRISFWSDHESASKVRMASVTGMSKNELDWKSIEEDYSLSRRLAPHQMQALTKEPGKVGADEVFKYVIRPGDILSNDEINQMMGNAASLENSDFYQNWMNPLGYHNILRMNLASGDKENVNLTLARSKEAGKYTKLEKGLCRLLWPSLMRAVKISEWRKLVEYKIQIFESFIDKLSAGIILADRNRRILYSNRFAKEILAQANGLWERDDILYGSGKSASAEQSFDELVEMTAQMRMDDFKFDVFPYHFIDLDARGDKQPLKIVVAPAQNTDKLLSYLSGMSLIVISTKDRKISLGRHYWRHAYDLTYREADLVEELINCGELAQAAENIGVKVDTARKYLKTIFQKTDVHGQSQLIRKMLFDIPKFINDFSQ